MIKGKELFVVLLFLLYGCTSVSTQRVVVSTGLDFTKYRDKGFLFTPLTYSGDYESCGLVNIVLYPEILVYGNTSNPERVFTIDGKTLTNTISNVWTCNKISYYKDMANRRFVEIPRKSELLDSAYSEAVKLKADAIIMMTFTESRNYGDPLILEGMAIKRK